MSLPGCGGARLQGGLGSELAGRALDAWEHRTFRPREELPYSRAGLLVEESSAYVKINARLMLTFTWNGEDSALVRLPTPTPSPPRGSPAGAGWMGAGALLGPQKLELPLPHPQLELDPRYANQTCGLCGDFNGLPAINEFYAHSECAAGGRAQAGRSQGGWGAGWGPRRDAGQGADRGVATLPVMPQREVSGVLSMGGSSAPRAPPGPCMECLLSADARLTPLQFGNLQKLDGPTEQCQDPLPSPADNCTDEVSACPQPLQIRAPPKHSLTKRGALRKPRAKALPMCWEDPTFGSGLAAPGSPKPAESTRLKWGTEASQGWGLNKGDGHRQVGTDPAGAG